jgi:uncharacterized protein (UPF0261 family)
LKKVLEEEGHHVHVVDTGALGEALFRPDTLRDQVAKAAGTSVAAIRDKNDRGHAVAAMSQGAAIVVRELYERRAIQGILAAGGSANTTIATTAMRALPVGFPKLMVSTLASGDVSPYVDTKDITMMYSVVDIAGINRISARILSNAARAIAAMAGGKEPKLGESKPLVSATMFGVTTPCVNAARKLLEQAGYEVLVFHATGTGGRAMENLIEDGYIGGVLDITTTELADELVGGIMSAGAKRLTVAGAAGLPQVVSIGAVDMVNFGPRTTVPPKFEGRKFYQHNPTVTLMRTTPDENAEIGRRIAERTRGAKGPVKILLPTKGVSAYAKKGGPFYDPEADGNCIEAIKKNVGAGIEVRLLDTDINDPEFARASAETLIELMNSGQRSKTSKSVH